MRLHSCHTNLASLLYRVFPEWRSDSHLQHVTRLVRIAGKEHDHTAGAPLGEINREFGTTHLRHDDVRHEKVNPAFISSGNLQSFESIFRFEHRISAKCQKLSREIPERIRIFNEQDCLGTP